MVPPTKLTHSIYTLARTPVCQPSVFTLQIDTDESTNNELCFYD